MHNMQPKRSLIRLLYLLDEVNNVTLKNSWSKVVLGRQTSTHLYFQTMVCTQLLPCHPKAKGPGHSMHSHKVPKIALHSLQNSSAPTGLLMIAFLVHGTVGYCFSGPSTTFTLSNLVLSPFKQISFFLK